MTWIISLLPCLLIFSPNYIKQFSNSNNQGISPGCIDDFLMSIWKLNHLTVVIMDWHRTGEIPRVFSSYFFKKAHSTLLLTCRSCYSGDKAGDFSRWYSGTAESTCPYSWISSLYRQLWQAIGFLTPGLCGLDGSSYSQLEGKEGKDFKKPPTPPSNFSFQNGYKGQATFPIFSPLYLMFHVPPGLGCQSPGRRVGKKMSLTFPQTKKEVKQQLKQ